MAVYPENDMPKRISIKFISLLERHIRRRPQLKRAIAGLLDHFPLLKMNLLRIVRNKKCSHQDTIDCLDDLSPYAREICHKLIEYGMK